MSEELNPELAEDLIHRGFESSELDYKETFDDSTGAWMELAKDVYGMSNYGGGYIVFGVEDGTFALVGLDPSFRKDTQDWIDRISKWASGNINLSYIEQMEKINGVDRKFPILRVHGSIGGLVIPKVDGKYVNKKGEDVTAFRLGVPYTRRATSTVMASGNEYWGIFWALMQRTAQKTGSQSTPLEVIDVLSAKTDPDAIEEVIWFNLFPVTEIPDQIHLGETEIRDASMIYSVVKSKLGLKGVDLVDVPSFMLADGKIYTFAPFDDHNPLRFCTTKTNSTIPTSSWIDDESLHRKLIMLLNYGLKDLCKRKGFFYDREHDRFFRKYFGGPVPTVTWKPYKKTSTRQLVFPRVTDGGRLLYCEHFAGRLRFIFLGSSICLVIEPIRVLTADGENPLDQKMNVRISTRRNFLYHNNNYLYDLKFWIHLLAGTSTEIHFGKGNTRTTVSVLPLNSKANFGIIDDQHTDVDFLDALKSGPFEYDISYEEEEENPLAESSLEE